LERAIEKDIVRGLTPFFVVGTLGTTSQAAFDNLVEIGNVCKKYTSLWFHVDGAYGGNAFLIQEMRKFKAGIEFVDSFEVNPNKLMMTAFDCTCMWVKDVLTFTAAFAVDPLYLQVLKLIIVTTFFLL
jgi:glutamate/tyrosine decarboxylase-like PLP-dependent enzyme